ncbi:MAG: ABC transporter ATP-binding protein [Thermomicrobiales bacterium]|nr:ABC transporter ATP-binding protein [Thermomicrobiales bacterium]
MVLSPSSVDVPDAPVAASSREPVIETKNLTKQFRRVLALDNLNVEVPPAAIGLLGPNGAGKTTLIRILLGLSNPTRGSASVLGMDTASDGVRIRERVGYMPESSVLPSNATAADFVGHMAEMSGLPKVAARQRAADVLYQVGLDEERYRLISGFSMGMKQRVKLAQAIVHDPQLVFLDEPTAGMDPPGRDSMLELIARIHTRMGMSVVLSSHILEDIERVCDFVMIINGGKLIMAQPIGKAREDMGEIVVRIDGDVDQFIGKLASLGVHDVRPGGTAQTSPFPDVIVRHTSDDVYDAIRDAAADMQLPIRTLRSRVHSLEELYLQAIESGDAAAGGEHGS